MGLGLTERDTAMGNRAVLTFTPEGMPGVGVYVHWNGGPASVRAFVDTCKARGYRSPAYDPAYAMAGLVSVIREFFGNDSGGLGVGVDLVSNLDCDNYDNGVYQIGERWEIVATWGKGSKGLKTVNAPLNGYALNQYQAIIDQLSFTGAVSQ